jgi:hypothetical protein
MKHFETILYLIQHLFLLCMGISLLAGIIIIAELFSWYFLMLYLPLILYGIGYKTKNFRR